MKTQDPIEKQLKERLDKVQKSTDIPTWSAISQSLQRRRGRRNQWLFGGSIALFITVAIFTYPKLTNTGTTTDGNTETTELSGESSNEVQELSTTKPEEQLEAVVTNNNEEISEDSEMTQETQIANNTDVLNESSEITTGEKANSNDTKSAVASKSKKKDPIEDYKEDAEVTTTFYSYNSETGKQTIYTDKKEIDSLKQSINTTKVRDSINQ